MANSTTRIWEKHFGDVAAVPFGENVTTFFDELAAQCVKEDMLSGKIPVINDRNGVPIYINSLVLYADDYERPDTFEWYFLEEKDGKLILRSKDRPTPFQKIYPLDGVRSQNLFHY